MPDYVYTGDEPRTYPSLGLEVEPGGTYSLSDVPDHRFTEQTDKPKKSPKSAADVPDGASE